MRRMEARMRALQPLRSANGGPRDLRHALEGVGLPRRGVYATRSMEEAMLIVDSQIHIWQNGKMSAHHRQIPTYSAADVLAEMASAGVDAAVIHPPSSLGEAVNTLAVE